MSATELGFYKVPVTLTGATVAAVLASLASQPGDALLSHINQCVRDDSCDTESSSPLREIVEAVRALGLSGLFR